MYALVTGASSGIGREIAKLLAEKKYNLIISARRADRLAELKDYISEKYGVNVIIMPADLSVSGNAAKLFKECLNYNVGVIINNAGFGKIGGFDSIPLACELDMINTNIIALHTLTKLFSESMEGGYILNVASMAAFQPGPKMAAYAATKAYVLSLSKAVNYELKKKGKPLHVSALCPGPVDTEFNDVANAHFNIKPLTAKRCARIAVKGLFKKKAVIIPGFTMKITHILTKLLPSCMVLPVQYRIQSNKTKV